MDIKEFIRKTISEIIDGVQSANSEYPKEVCPKSWQIDSKSRNIRNLANPHLGVFIQEVEFDVAVTVNNTNKTTGGGKIEVAGIFKLCGEKGKTINNSVTSRIKFHVPIALYNKSDAVDETEA